MHRSSPPRKVAAWTKDEVASAEDPTTADFVNLERSTVRHQDGFAYGEYAILPEKAEYDKIRVSFGPATLDDVSDAAISVWFKGSDGGIVLLGTSKLGADGQFPPVTFENHQGEYAVTVSAITDDGGAGPKLSVDVYVQGLFETLSVP